jgi:transcriptional regulator of acetoin/glycerol metabolism
LSVNLDEPLLEGRERIRMDYERLYIEKALGVTEGNISRAAAKAKVSRNFMHKAVKRYGLGPVVDR